MKYIDQKIQIIMIIMVLMHTNMFSMMRTDGDYWQWRERENEFFALLHLYKITRNIFNTHKIEKKDALNDFLVPDLQYRTKQGLILHVDNRCPSLGLVITPWGLVELYRTTDTMKHDANLIKSLVNITSDSIKEKRRLLFAESDRIRRAECEKANLIASELLKKCEFFDSITEGSFTTNFDGTCKDFFLYNEFLQPVLDANYTLKKVEKCHVPKAIRVNIIEHSSSRAHKRIQELEEKKVLNEWEALKDCFIYQVYHS